MADVPRVRRQVYVSKPADYPPAPARLLLLLTGGTGMRSVNNQLQADRYAAAGFVVVMPDLFGGDTAPAAAALVADHDHDHEHDQDHRAAAPSLLDRLKLRTAEVAKSFLTDMWLARTTSPKVMPVLARVVGARFVILLAKRPGPDPGPSPGPGPGPGPPPRLKAAALAHAASVAPDDFADLAAPLSLACGEDDPLFPDALRSAAELAMSDAQLEQEVRFYPDVPHGDSAPPKYPSSGRPAPCRRGGPMP